MLRLFIAGFAFSPFRARVDEMPWAITQALPDLLATMLAGGLGSTYAINEGVAIHRDAIVETGAVVKGRRSSHPAATSPRAPICAAASGWTRAAPSARDRR